RVASSTTVAWMPARNVATCSTRRCLPGIREASVLLNGLGHLLGRGRLVIPRDGRGTVLLREAVDLPVVAGPAQLEGHGEPVAADRVGGLLAGCSEDAGAPDLDRCGGVGVAGDLRADRHGARDVGAARGGVAFRVQAEVLQEVLGVRLVETLLQRRVLVLDEHLLNDGRSAVGLEDVGRHQHDRVVRRRALRPLAVVREPRRDPARLRVHRLLPRGGCRRRLGGVGLRGAGGRAVSAAVREGDGGDEEDHHADHRDQAAGRRAAGSARAAVRTAALALGQVGPGLARATVALGGLVLVSETHAAYAPSTSSGNTSYSVYSSYDGSRAGPRAGAVW